MIRVFVGSSPKYRHIERHIEHAIRRHASQAVSVTFMRPGEHGLVESGCTGFTMFRYAIPELCNYSGYAIYLDVDMLLVSDIAELWEYRTEGKWACLEDGSNEVMVVDCSAFKPPRIAELHRYRKTEVHPPYSAVIPLDWNCEDCAREGAKLIHFTDLTRQPWFTPSREDDAVALLRENEAHYLLCNTL